MRSTCLPCFPASLEAGKQGSRAAVVVVVVVVVVASLQLQLQLQLQLAGHKQLLQ